MGILAIRSDGGTRLTIKRRVTIHQLMAGGEIDPTDAVYEITTKGMKRFGKNDVLEPGKAYGVVPSNNIG